MLSTCLLPFLRRLGVQQCCLQGPAPGCWTRPKHRAVPVFGASPQSVPSMTEGPEQPIPASPCSLARVEGCRRRPQLCCTRGLGEQAGNHPLPLSAPLKNTVYLASCSKTLSKVSSSSSRGSLRLAMRSVGHRWFVGCCVTEQNRGPLLQKVPPTSPPKKPQRYLWSRGVSPAQQAPAAAFKGWEGINWSDEQGCNSYSGAATVPPGICWGRQHCCAQQRVPLSRAFIDAKGEQGRGMENVRIHCKP